MSQQSIERRTVLKTIGHSSTYQGGRNYAKSQGYDFAYVVASNEAPIWTPRFAIIVEELDPKEHHAKAQ
jgi:hypothetical protein